MYHTNENRRLLLMQRIYAALISFAKELNRQNNKYFQELTARQYMVILAIRLSPQNETTMASVAKKLGATKQNVNQLIAVLEKKGYVSKTICEKNKRAVNVKVTEPGVKVMLAHTQKNISFITDIFFSFTENELEVLWDLLRKLRTSEEFERITALQ